MAGTIVVDRIESDASYASTINVAGQIAFSNTVNVAGQTTFSNTVNFGVFAGAAPVSGFYSPSTNNLAFTTASTERVRVDSTGNVKLMTASTNIQNSSGNPILRQSGSVLKVQQFTDAGSSTTAGSLVNLNGAGFQYTPVSTNSTLYLTITAYAYNYPVGGYAAGSVYGFYAIGEYNGSVYAAISNTGYLWNYQFSSTYGQSIAAQAYMTCTRSNTSLTTRSFDLMGAISNANMNFNGLQIVFRVMEVAA